MKFMHIPRIPLLSAKPSSLLSIFVLVFVLVAIGAIVFINVFLFREWNEMTRVKLQHEAELMTLRVERTFQDSFKTLDSLKGLLKIKPDLNKMEFQSFGEIVVEGQNALLAIQYADEQTKIKYVYPEERNEITLREPMVLLDDPLRSGPTRKAIRQNRRTLQEPFMLRQGVFGTVAREPVFINGEFLGLVIGVYSIEALIDDLFPSPKQYPYNFLLENQEGEPLYEKGNLIEEVVRMAVHIGDMEWVLRLSESENFNEPRETLKLLISLSSLLLIILVIVLANRIWHYTHGLEKRVQQRTEKLKKLNQTLKDEHIETGKALEQLKMSREKYRLMIESVSDGIITVSEDLRIQTCNSAAMALFKRRKQELLDLPFTDLVPLEYRREEADYLRAFFAYRETRQIPKRDTILRISDKRKIPIEIIYCFPDRDNPHEAALVLRQKNGPDSGGSKGIESIRIQRESHHKLRERLGVSAEILEVVRQAEIVASTDMNVILQGESGTGKEIIAHLIHDMSTRREAPFIAVDCGAIAPSLFESELFGHEKGAFTSAEGRKNGKLELAQGGTLFLDEVTNLSLENQVKLLRVFQERQYYRVGGNTALDLDCRVVVATNIDLQASVKDGKFRIDLYHRFNEFQINLPRLQDRKEDILHLSHFFVSEANEDLGRRVEGLSNSAEDALLHHGWPGNVRELKNVIRRAVLFASGPLITDNDLQLTTMGREQKGEATLTEQIWQGNMTLKEALDSITADYEREIIREVLKRLSGNRSIAAERLGLNRKTLYTKVKNYGIEER